MLKIKNLTRFTLVVLFLAMAVSTPSKVRAQDDDEPMIVPPSSSSQAPTPIIDDSDSGSVGDVEEYDG